MKYFKKFLILGLFVLFGVSICSAENSSISFSGSYNFTYTGTSTISSTYTKSVVFPISFYSSVNNGTTNISYRCSFSNFSYSNSDFYNYFSSQKLSIGYGQYSIENVSGVSPYYYVGYSSSNNFLRSSNNSQLRFSDLVGNNISGYSTIFFTSNNGNFQYLPNFYFPFYSNTSTYSTSCSSVPCSFSFDYDCNFVYNSDYVFVNNLLVPDSSSGGGSSSSCDTGSILSGYILESSVDQSYCTSNNLCPSCPSCPDQYTSLECQTEYNLIPISEVTKNYCEINFDLIDPIDCPSSPSSGSGEVSRSALYVNNVQYNGAPNLYVNINDLLDYSMTYVEGSAVIDVDGYKADTGYMSDILTIQEYHPSSEDFTVAFVSVLTYALPYVIVALFVLFIWKLIKKIFKS